MFVFLSKKIAIPNGSRIHSLAWNHSQGWIACGGERGLLKVLKLETSTDSRARGVAAPSNLSMNQSCEGHGGAVVCCTWNSVFRKLTTSDENGLIIVWMLHRSEWYEEMINNRNRSVVTSMKWSADGQRICIGYADGAVIVGGVDGNRIWAKELGMELSFVEWSPDCRNIIFVNKQSKVFLYDNRGNRIAQIGLHITPESSEDGDEDRIIGVDWYDGVRGHVDIDAPDLVIGFAHGRVQITKGVDLGPRKRQPEPSPGANDDAGKGGARVKTVEDATAPTVLIDTGMRLTKLAWNCNGSILALAGTQETAASNGETRSVCMVQFYSPFGQHLRTLKVPGSSISAITWDGSGLRIALAVDSFIYFANLRLDYRWGAFGNTLCYAYTRHDRTDTPVVFWDTHTDERHTRHVRRLIAIRAAGDNAVLATRSTETLLVQGSKGREKTIRQHTLVLCNAIGSPVDTRVTSVEPIFLAMTSTHVIAANEHAIFSWQYHSSSGGKQGPLVGPGSNGINALQASLMDVTGAVAGTTKVKNGRERVFHIDNDPNRVCVMGMANVADGQKLTGKKSVDMRNLLADILTKETPDAITCIAANDRCLIVGRESGTLHRYLLPHMTLEGKYVVRCRPHQIALNCNSTKLGIIDINSVMTILDLDARSESNGQAVLGEQLAFERKDAWDMLWASDNADLIAVMEKTRLYVFRNLESEEPVLSSGYLSKHADLQIKAAMLDEILAQPINPTPDMVVDFPTKSLRDVREMLHTVGVDDAYEYIEAHPHPRLWRLLAEAALERLEFGVADKAFVRCNDYPGIQFVKSLKSLNDRVKQRARVAAYFERFDESENLYRDIDRKDLAIDLRIMLGDWFKVVQLVQSGGGVGDDELLRTAWQNIGDYYASRQKWNKAVQYFASAKDPASLIECYYLLEEYASLEKLVRVIPEGSPLLKDIGRKFQSVGMSEAASLAFLKAGDVKAAIDCCVLLNDWDKAVQLAQEHEFPQIEGLLAKYASHLLDKGDKLQAIELYRKAGKSTQAATLLASLAQEAGRSKVNPLGAKRLHVLAAMEMEELRTRVLDTQLKTMGLKEEETTQRDMDEEYELGTMNLKPQRTQVTVAQATAATLESLVQHDAATGENRSLDNAWHGAEAFHFFMLAQRQLYANQLRDALATALQLRAYDDVLDPREVYSLIALASYLNSAWGQCSKAFIELESLKPTSCSKADRERFAKLALAIFTANRPQDPPEVATLVEEINKGRASGYPICMISGKPINEKQAGRVYKCRRCSRKMLEDCIRSLNHCPLCHMMLV